jgi:hypothetical protein
VVDRPNSNHLGADAEVLTKVNSYRGTATDSTIERAWPTMNPRHTCLIDTLLAMKETLSSFVLVRVEDGGGSVAEKYEGSATVHRHQESEKKSHDDKRTTQDDSQIRRCWTHAVDDEGRACMIDSRRCIDHVFDHPQRSGAGIGAMVEQVRRGAGLLKQRRSQRDRSRYDNRCSILSD